MRGLWWRIERRLAPLATGGVTLGILTGLSMVNFSWIFTNFLSQLLGTLIALLFGASAQAVLFGNQTGTV